MASVEQLAQAIVDALHRSQGQGQGARGSLAGQPSQAAALMARNRQTGEMQALEFDDELRGLAVALMESSHYLLHSKHADTTPGTVAQGDLITGQGATPKWARLAKGTDGQYLRLSGSDPAWQDLTDPAVSVALYNAAGVSIANATATELTWSDEDHDTSGLHTAAAAEVVLDAARKVHVFGRLKFAVSGIGKRWLRLYKNYGAGSEVLLDEDTDVNPSVTEERYLKVFATVSLAAADELSLVVYQDSGGALDVCGGGGRVAGMFTVTSASGIQGPSGTSAPHPGLFEARLTLETGVAVSTTDQVGKSTLYLTPIGGSRVSFYDVAASDFVTRTMTADSSKVLSGLVPYAGYAVWGYDNSGTPALEFEAFKKVTATNDPAAGADVTIDLADTGGLACGDLVVVRDGSNNELALIKSVALDTSITVYDLANSYTKPDVYFGNELETAITYVQGVPLKTGDLSRRFLGIFFATAANATSDAEGARLVCNENNQTMRALRLCPDDGNEYVSMVNAANYKEVWGTGGTTVYFASLGRQPALLWTQWLNNVADVQLALAFGIETFAVLLVYELHTNSGWLATPPWPDTPFGLRKYMASCVSNSRRFYVRENGASYDRETEEDSLLGGVFGVCYT